MTITSYEELSPLGQIIYVRYMQGTLTDAQLALYLSKGKITQEEYDFIYSCRHGST